MKSQISPFGLSDEGPIEKGLKPTPEFNDLPGEQGYQKQTSEGEETHRYTPKTAGLALSSSFKPVPSPGPGPSPSPTFHPFLLAD